MKLVQTPKEFLNEFTSRIKKSKDSVYIQSMNFESGKVMDRIEKAVEDAVGRGVDVHINYDWVSQKFVHGELPIFPVLNKTERVYGNTLHKKNEEMVKRFFHDGVILHKTNVPIIGVIPHQGRNHIKMYIVDQKIAWVGGVNLFDEGFENIDVMVKILDTKLIIELVDQFRKVKQQHKFDDYKKQCGDNYSLYVDSGKKGKSIIYSRAVKLIEESKESITVMSPFLPDGELLKQLIKASKRGIKVLVITSPIPNKHTHILDKLSFLLFLSRTKGNKNIKLIHTVKYIHAKLLLIDNKIAFFGSHNLTYAGILLGTSEIMIETKDLQIVKQINLFFANHIQNRIK